MNIQTKIIMVGPHPLGHGGISRVIALWKDNDFFSSFNVEYIPSVAAPSVNRHILLLKGVFLFLRHIIQNCTIVYIHASSFNSFYRKSIFLIIALLFKKKIIFHIHPFHFIPFLDNTKGLRRKLIFFLLNRIDLFVVLTNLMVEKIQISFPKKKVLVLNNPVSFKDLENVNNYKRTDNNVIYLGSYLREKGIYELVDAVSILKSQGCNIVVDFFGSGEVEKLRKYVRDNKLSEMITVNKWIGHKDKVKHLYRSAMLILPSHSEGVPNVILEAMATKTPIVATLVGGLKEVLRDEQNSIITNVEDPQDLSGKIYKCLTDHKLRDRIVENAYEDAKSNYDIEIIKKKFCHIIQEFIDNSKFKSLST